MRARRAGAMVALVALVCSAASLIMSAPPAAAAGGDGMVRTFGSAGFYGSLARTLADRYAVAMASTPSGNGYWITTTEGGVFTFGDARFHGSLGNVRLNSPVIGITPTPAGDGYWLFARDGGVFTFGAARFFGSTGGMQLNSPVVGMAATPGGNGYWLFARDGGVFSFGGARFHGSTGGATLNAPIVAMASSPTAEGYWLVARDGGVFSFGAAPFLGSAAARRPDHPVVGLAPTATGSGYWIATEGGDVFAFGDARQEGDAGGRLPEGSIVTQITGKGRGGYRLLVRPIPDETVLLGYGSSGARVADLQIRLVQLGFWLGRPEGVYGTLTSQAVMAFQKYAGLPRTGVYDGRTARALRGAVRPTGRSSGGAVLEIDKARQLLLLVVNGRVEWAFNTSTGSGRPYGYDGQSYVAITPEGQFRVLRQIDGLRISRLGQLYRPKYFTGGGIAIHGSPSIPGYPASHGCVRLTNAAMDWIWAANAAPLGREVWVY